MVEEENHLQDFFSWFVLLCFYVCRLHIMLICRFSGSPKHVSRVAAKCQSAFISSYCLLKVCANCSKITFTFISHHVFCGVPLLVCSEVRTAARAFKLGGEYVLTLGGTIFGIYKTESSFAAIHVNIAGSASYMKLSIRL